MNTCSSFETSFEPSNYAPLPTSSPELSPSSITPSQLQYLKRKDSTVSNKSVFEDEAIFDFPYELMERKVVKRLEGRITEREMDFPISPSSSSDLHSCTAIEDFVMDQNMDLSDSPLDKLLNNNNNNEDEEYAFLSSEPTLFVPCRILKSTKRRKAPPAPIYTGVVARRPVSYHRQSSAPPGPLLPQRLPSPIRSPLPLPLPRHNPTIKKRTQHNPPVAVFMQSPTRRRTLAVTVTRQQRRSSPFSLPPNSTLPLCSTYISKTPTYQTTTFPILLSSTSESRNVIQSRNTSKPNKTKRKPTKIFFEYQNFNQQGLDQFFAVSAPPPSLPAKEYESYKPLRENLEVRERGERKYSRDRFRSYGEDFGTALLLDEKGNDTWRSMGRKQSLSSKLKFW